MILFKSYRERIRLLEYENEILAKRLSDIEKHLKLPNIPVFPHPQIIREDGWDLSYNILRKKHREYTPNFNDGF